VEQQRLVIAKIFQVFAACFYKKNKTNPSSLAANNLHSDFKEDEIPVCFIRKHSFAPPCKAHAMFKQEN